MGSNVWSATEYELLSAADMVLCSSMYETFKMVFLEGPVLQDMTYLEWWDF